MHNDIFIIILYMTCTSLLIIFIILIILVLLSGDSNQINVLFLVILIWQINNHQRGSNFKLIRVNTIKYQHPLRKFARQK